MRGPERERNACILHSGGPWRDGKRDGGALRLRQGRSERPATFEIGPDPGTVTGVSVPGDAATTVHPGRHLPTAARAGRREAVACRCPPASETLIGRHQQPTGRAVEYSGIWLRGVPVAFVQLTYYYSKRGGPFSVLARTGLHRSQANVQPCTFPSM
jgi:hypothetical protein